jgi:hypothetical protein
LTNPKRRFKIKMALLLVHQVVNISSQTSELPFNEDSGILGDLLTKEINQLHEFRAEGRVARRYIFNLDKFEGLGMENVGTFYAHLEYRYICYGHLVYFRGIL